MSHVDIWGCTFGFKSTSFPIVLNVTTSHIPVFLCLNNRDLFLLPIGCDARINLPVLVKQLIYGFCGRLMSSWSLWSPQRRAWWWELRCVCTTRTDLGLLAIRKVSHIRMTHLCGHTVFLPSKDQSTNKMNTKLPKWPLVHYCLYMTEKCCFTLVCFLVALKLLFDILGAYLLSCRELE